MRFPALTKRLSAAYNETREGATAADVGTDHGKLAAALAAGRSRFVWALDINELPLEKARALFSRLGLEGRAVALLSDGLDALEFPYPDDVIMAGMGADVISGIISRAEWLKDGNKRLVIVPSSRDAAMRKYLYKNGFEIINESAVSERGHCYAVMTARYGGNCRELGEGEAAAGLIRADTPDGKSYLETKLKNANKVIRETAKHKNETPEALEAARERAKYIETVLEGPHHGA